MFHEAMEFSAICLHTQITGLSFSSVDQSFIYVQGVDYEVCIQLISLVPCFVYLIVLSLLVLLSTCGLSVTYCVIFVYGW